MVQEAHLKIYARGVVSYFYFFRAPPLRALKIRQINSAISKVPDGAWWSCLLDTDSWRGTVRMEPPMSINNSSMHTPSKSRFRFRGYYRGFNPKPAGIRIINFRVGTRLQSKSNRCI
jgi:hypothetical protein